MHAVHHPVTFQFNATLYIVGLNPDGGHMWHVLKACQLSIRCPLLSVE